MVLLYSFIAIPVISRRYDLRVLVCDGADQEDEYRLIDGYQFQREVHIGRR